MGRALSPKNLYDKKHDEFAFDGVWYDAMQNPDKNGAWLIWGNEKNGKTWVTLILANYLSEFERVHYMSAEEGTGKAFIESLKRAKISPTNRSLHFGEYETVEELYIRLKRRNGPKVVIIDNITAYNDELKNGGFKKLLRDFPDVLFIFLAHEDRGEPYTATAKLVKRWAKIIFYVEGLACNISGRCKGGKVVVDEERAELYHGHQILNKA